MFPPASPAAARLADAGQQLREQLQRLEANSQYPVQPLCVGELLQAFEQYEQAVLSLAAPPLLPWSLNPTPTPAELLAEREACPLYRLGWVRGYQAGQVAGQRKAEPALGLYARHAALPAPADPTTLMQQVRRFIAQLQQRYGAGPITQTTRLHPAT